MRHSKSVITVALGGGGLAQRANPYNVLCPKTWIWRRDGLQESWHVPLPAQIVCPKPQWWWDRGSLPSTKSARFKDAPHAPWWPRLVAMGSKEGGLGVEGKGAKLAVSRHDQKKSRQGQAISMLRKFYMSFPKVGIP